MFESPRVRSSVFYPLVPVFAVSVAVLLLVTFSWGSMARAIEVDIGRIPPVEVYFSPRNGATQTIVP
jgi:hypothetical protein